MNLDTFLDVVCILPFVPLAPFIFVWFLPWEDWVLKQLPPSARQFLGPYFLYLSVALLHFNHGWFALLWGLTGIVETLNVLFPEKAVCFKKFPPETDRRVLQASYAEKVVNELTPVARLAVRKDSQRHH